MDSCKPVAKERPAWWESRFLRAARREPVDRLPVWLMRQAGRFMPEYREIRGDGDFLNFCRDPRRCARVMEIAVRQLGVDAAIVFSDLLVILEPLGLHVRYSGGGPQITNPIREPDDVRRLRPLESIQPLEFVLEAIWETYRLLPAEIPLIGFAGAPFTLASYAIEGGSDGKSFLRTKSFMYRFEEAWFDLLELLARAVGRFLSAQIEAGVAAVQIFDTWAGCLSPSDYEQFVLPQMRKCFASLPADFPVIHFATGNPALLPLMDEAGGTVLGVDWRIRLDEAFRVVGARKAIQGNLDPAVLLAPKAMIEKAVRQLLHQWNGRPGYIFNLGHGVLPQTPVEHVKYLVDLVHEESARILDRH